MENEKLVALVSQVLNESPENVRFALNGEGSLSLHQLRVLAGLGLETSIFLVGVAGFIKAKKELGLEDKDEIGNETIKSDVLSIKETQLRDFAEREPRQYSVNKAGYESWEMYRFKTHKKKTTPKSKAKDYLLLRKYPQDIQLTIIEKSMGEGWYGLFPPSWEKVEWKKENRVSTLGEGDMDLLKAFEGVEDE